MISDVKQFTNYGRNIIYLKGSGQCGILFYSDIGPEIAEVRFDWSDVLPVDRFAASYNFAVFIIKETEETREMNSHILEQFTLGVNVKNLSEMELKKKISGTKRNILVFNTKDLGQEAVNSAHNRYKRVTNCPYEEIISLGVGNASAFLAGGDHTLQEISLNSYDSAGGFENNHL